MPQLESIVAGRGSAQGKPQRFEERPIAPLNPLSRITPAVGAQLLEEFEQIPR